MPQVNTHPEMHTQRALSLLLLTQSSPMGYSASGPHGI